MLHPVSQGQIPQVSASAEDQKGGEGGARWDAFIFLKNWQGKKTQQEEETQLSTLHIVVPR